MCQGSNERFVRHEARLRGVQSSVSKFVPRDFCFVAGDSRRPDELAKLDELRHFYVECRTTNEGRGPAPLRADFSTEGLNLTQHLGAFEGTFAIVTVLACLNKKVGDVHVRCASFATQVAVLIPP